MKQILLLIAFASLMLSSCNSVRESAGVNRKVIDEYAVIENPPLVIPPNFNLIPPEQIKAKDINNTDNELAKEILFGLDDTGVEIDDNTNLMNEIVKESQGKEFEENIRNIINEEFAGEKSSIDDETTFYSEEEINKVIEETQNKNSDEKVNSSKEKKKKRFFFF